MMANPKRTAYSLPQPSNDLNGPIKGHVALKSGPYATTCTRLSNQGIVQDQMNTHYKKLNKAKSCIDASPPKSMTLSVKKRDQMRRDAMIKSHKAASSPDSSRPNSSATPRPDSARPGSARPGSARQGSPSRRALDQSFTSAELNQLATDGNLSPSPYGQYANTASLYRSQPDGQRAQSRLSETAGSKSLRFKETTNGPRMTESARLRPDRLKQTQPASGDVLDKMADRFSQADKPHTPRTLKTNAQSRLAQSNIYNKPKRPTKKTNRQNGIDHEHDDIEYEQNIQDYEDRLLEEGDDFEDSPRRNPDHVRWVEDQAKRVESLRLDGLTREGAGFETEEGEDLHLSQSYQRPFYSTGNLSNRPPSRISKRMKDEEEELRYLEFVTDVTNDVLNRGIFTNSVLKQVFDSHINRNKDRLDEGRMRHLMAQLQEDLFIPNSDDEDKEPEETRGHATS
ncbi:spermatogenesis-associated protein 7 homolog [Patiria miniata]|uniref:Spermatogenesis-associated protein 7 homolog n=1 Tax=Patiria miniata TaxID=46514 RepID=A0A914BBW1_PATMI|nr:spermatogenesis-associated protein 7 homolog [Patiria miniata]XP_038073320.1 spermatogenesis-associated protein 7 homolog [Patiria miniata]